MFWSDARGTVCLVLVALALAACQPIPRIFQPEDKSRNDFSAFAIADKVGVFVGGIDNAPPAADQAITAALVERLQELDIPASATSANRGSYLLTCNARLDGNHDLTLSWRLIDADGLIVGLVDQRSTVEIHTWATGDPALVAAIVGEAGPRLAAVIGDHDPAILARAKPGLLRVVHVPPVRGAPGDGGKSLTRAMRSALKFADLSLSDNPQEAGVQVRGEVSVVDQGAFEQVTIRWRVVDNESGQLGVVSQSNQIPAGTLDGAWGQIAPVIAQGGAEGVIGILSEIGAPAPTKRSTKG